MKAIRLKTILAAAWLLCGAVSARTQPTNAAHTVDELRLQITAHIEQSRFDAALWGVKIVSLDSGKIILDAQADRLMSPASNSKLYAGSLALDRLGADYKIVTPIFATTAPDSRGIVQGDIVVAGRGDPGWSQRLTGRDFAGLFAPFVAVLTNAGVRQVTGDIVGDATFFRSPPQGGSWTVDDLENSEGAEISALTLNDNFSSILITPGARAGDPCQLGVMDPFTGLELDNHTLTGTNGAARNIVARRFRGENVVHVFGVLPLGGLAETNEMPVLRPAEWFARSLKNALQQNGITVAGVARAVSWPSPAPAANIKMGEVVSPRLGELVRNFMKPSQNLETDLIFEHTGEMARTTNTPPWETSEELALRALHDFLATNNLPAADVHFDEGSGLSRNNLTSANATVALLQFMSRHHDAPDFIASLPIAGVDGTLRRRMKNTTAYQNVRAKTGTLRWVNALSGFVTTAAGEHLVFSLMLNRYDAPPGRKRTDELDDIAVMLAQFTGRTDEPLEKTYASFGTLIVTPFASAPFPHPARAEGHKYHDEFFSAAEHYSDSTVAMFIPKNFRPDGKVDFVVHFHGWRNTVAGTLEQFRLIQQFSDSGKNAILIVPEGPHDAADSFGGKLEDTNGFAVFMDEAMEKLRANGPLKGSHFEIGNIILAGHSGGYHVMGAILDHGGLAEHIKEAWLFDALYGGTEYFAAWQKKFGGRLLDIYTDHGGTKKESEQLMAGYRARNTSFFAGEDAGVLSEDLRGNKIIFLHTDMVHNEVVAKRGTFGQFLKTSCLQNIPGP